MPDYGIIKWYNAPKGVGFITRDDKVEVLLHHSNVSAYGFRPPSEGDLVSFTSATGSKGLEAKNVVRVDSRS